MAVEKESKVIGPQFKREKARKPKVEKKAEKNLLQFALFTAIGAIGLGINVGITTFLTRQIGINYLISNTIAQIVVFFFNFFMRKKFVFEKKA